MEMWSPGAFRLAHEDAQRQAYPRGRTKFFCNETHRCMLCNFVFVKKFAHTDRTAHEHSSAHQSKYASYKTTFENAHSAVLQRRVEESRRNMLLKRALAAEELGKRMARAELLDEGAAVACRAVLRIAFEWNSKDALQRAELLVEAHERRERVHALAAAAGAFGSDGHLVAELVLGALEP